MRQWVSSAGVEHFRLVPVKRGVVKLLGKDGSGKTSLKLSLKKEMFNSKQTRTLAIEIEMIRQDTHSDHWKTVFEGKIKEYVSEFLRQRAEDRQR